MSRWGPCEEKCGQAIAFRCRHCYGQYCRSHITSHSYCIDKSRDSQARRYGRRN